MKILFKGKLNDETEIVKFSLPSNAVKLEGADTVSENNMRVAVYLLPTIVISIGIVYMLLHYRGFSLNYLLDNIELVPLLIFIATIPIHEALHAVCYGKNSTSYVYFGILMAYVLCGKAIPKFRHIVMSLCPNIILGMIPLILWLVFFYNAGFGSVLLSYAVLAIIAGACDYAETFHIIVHVPKGAMMQASGLNTYWFMPDSDMEETGVTEPIE